MIAFEYLILFLLVVLLAYLIQFRWKRQRLHDLAKNLPGHDGLSIFESIKLATKISRRDYIPIMSKFIKDDAPITKLWLANYLTILTKDPDFIHKIFNCSKTYNKPKVFYQMFFMDHALTPMGGDDHKRHRRILNKAFTSAVMHNLPEIFNEKAKKIVTKMEEKVGRGEFDLMDYVGALSLESFGKINLNYEIDYFQSEIYYSMKRFVEFCKLKVFVILGIVMKKVNVELAQIFKNFNNFIAKVIDSNKSRNSQENSIVQLLLDPKNHFSNQEIYEELILTTMASFATSTKTLAATLVLLAMHKDKQQKLFDEIDEIYSTESDTKFSNDFLQKFIYLDAVLKESMRIFPAIPIIGREASEEVEIEGYLIPKGTVILISIFAMHRDKKIWGDDADAFKPERFFEELTNPHAFVPFAG
ncbi:unnamed protein product [Chironomus riparius]|uniref:Cytochrome P450 n=1 Tax=Chironomus riparius TaxID=315576 RepID=A0A9N9S5V8_9DIPT|nr:unnamed protein product [Chironomus riparius]